MRKIPDPYRQRAYLELLSKITLPTPPSMTAPVADAQKREAERYYQAVFLQQRKLDQQTED